MTPRERVLTAVAHCEADRVPIGFDCNAALEAKLFAHCGVDNRLDLYDALGIDGFSVFTDSYVYPGYVGPAPVVLPDGGRCDFFGIDHHQRHLPLAFVETAADLDRYAWPQVDWFDFATVRARCEGIQARGRVTVGGEGGCGIQHAINLRGYEQALVDPLADPELTHAYLSRMGDFFVAWNEAWLGAAAGALDIFRCGDDMGNTQAMHCSPEVWRTFYKPQLARIFAVAKRHGLTIWFHCCGCCRPVLEDLIEIGVDLWDPVPGYVAGNDQAELKARYGEQLAFVGGVDQPGVLVQGTPAQVRDEVARVVEVFAPGGGFILAGSQVLTDDVPLNNALALFEAAREFGRY